MQKKKNVTRYGDDEAWISKLVPGCSSVAAERLKHHTVFFTALYWLVSSLAHSWTDFFFFFLMHGDMNSCYRCCWMSERGADSPQSLLTSLQIQNINYMRWYCSPMQCDIRYLNERPTLSTTVVGCVSVSSSSWQSNASSSERLTLKAAYSTHIYICCSAGTSSGRFDYYSSKGGSHVK